MRLSLTANCAKANKQALHRSTKAHTHTLTLKRCTDTASGSHQQPQQTPTQAAFLAPLPASEHWAAAA